MPTSNLKQDALRARIRGGEARAITRTGRQWLASTDTRRFYSYEFAEDGSLIEPTVYELDVDAVHLAQVVNGKAANWTDVSHLKITDTETLTLNGMEVASRKDPETVFAGVESPAVFKPTIDKPSQLSASDLQVFYRIVLPLISPTVVVVGTTMIIFALKAFDIVYVMTNGNYETEVIANRMYKEMFNVRDFGRASAIAVVLLAAIVPVMLMNINRFRAQEERR